jgi:LAS superfamily LD-carboxypeptidase LdcB
MFLMKTDHKMKILEGGLGAILVLALIGYGIYSGLKLKKETAASKARVAELEGSLDELNKNLFETENQKADLETKLSEERSINENFESQIAKISGTVGVLDKLSKTDPQLLEKYSKVYFLNENYIPSELALLPNEFVYPVDKKIDFHAKAIDHLLDLLKEAKDDSLDLKVISGYRSFGTQAALKNSYKVTYGAGTANSFSADQGYSEHQLGTALDFTTTKLGATFNSFELTPEYKWLLNNAYKYGFILSYPKSNAYYQFEPWHWRYVGVKLADRIHDDQVNFYDMDQRAINEYLVSIFD